MPLDPDSDNDDLLDGEEILIGTDPLNDDTDGDLLHDGDEIHIYGTNPLSIDTDGDELTDTYELTINTNATNPDTDGDGLRDNVEVLELGTNDTDGDRLTDYEEVMIWVTNATLDDSDGDLLDDYIEVVELGSNPWNNDTDSDGLADGAEYYTYGTNVTLADSDGDTLSDYDELMLFGTNPLNADTDSDFWLDDTDPFPTLNTVLFIGPIIIFLFIGLVVIKQIRDRRLAKEFVTEAEPASLGLEPGMDVVVEYKIREGKVIFGVVVRNGSINPMHNVMVVLGVPDLTDTIKSENVGTIEADTTKVLELEFELQPGAEGELVGMVEYDSITGEHRIVNLRPVKIVA
ncbi:MAG: hypothetical protein ACW97A_01800 [Candidatus Thorarchaeota archaeon]